MKGRTIGIDVARALAIIGMVIVNFKLILGSDGSELLQSVANVFTGKAVAIFVVLAGIGIALMTNKAVGKQDVVALKEKRIKILKRAIFLFVIGLSYIWIWPADILHFYGIYMIITLFFITRSQKEILIAAILLIVSYPILILVFDYEAGWNFSTLDYLDFWTLNGFFRNLFFNGFHPVFPWTAFMLFGLWYGKQDLTNTSFIKKVMWVSYLVFIIVQFTSLGLMSVVKSHIENMSDVVALFGTEPMPPLPIYMINGISISSAVISTCILLCHTFRNSRIVNSLANTGKLALTFYVAHVILGVGLMEELGPRKLGEYSIEFSLAYSLIFCVLCILFAEIWFKFKTIGPLEWVMRKITD